MEKVVNNRAGVICKFFRCFKHKASKRAIGYLDKAGSQDNLETLKQSSEVDL